MNLSWQWNGKRVESCSSDAYTCSNLSIRAVLCCALLCCALLCSAVLCFALLCYAILLCAEDQAGEDLSAFKRPHVGDLERNVFLEFNFRVSLKSHTLCCLK